MLTGTGENTVSMRRAPDQGSTVGQFSLNDIAEWTGFNQGDLFESASGVREYFTQEAMDGMGLGGFADGERQLTQQELDVMAQQVIDNHWHTSWDFTLD